jgi:RNA polymerase sigma-70 factor (ECF subfamily)
MNPRGPDDWFVEHLIPIQDRLYRYIASLVPVRADAEDLCQKTWLTAWQKRDSFDQTRDFFAWVCGVARNHVHHYHRRPATKQVTLDADVVEQLAQRLLEVNDYLQEQQRALSHCLDRLPPKQKHLVEQLYRGDRSVPALAKEIGSTVDAVYKALQRIRSALHDCVRATLAREGWS